MVICPRCFSSLDKSTLAWGCANPDCPREGIPTTSTEKHPICTECNTAMSLRFCPTCGFAINNSGDFSQTIPISIVGSESAGKSNYMTVLINEIRGSLGNVYNCSLFPTGGDDTIVHYENLYYKPLYEQGKCLTSTNQEDVRPLIYSLVFDDKKVGQTCNITFYDSCGSNFRNERVMEDYNRSIFNSRGIILLLDPTQIPGLREEYINSGKKVLPDDFSSILSRTIKVIREGNQQKDLKSKIDIPIAICISKLDLIKEKLDPGSYLNYPSRHLNQPIYDSIDHNCCSQEVRSVIENWAGSDFINQVSSQFSNYAFFGFSSLGSQPDEANEIDRVLPLRVCDPFLWILSQNKIIREKAIYPAIKK